jgi:hypothetical protein
MPLFERRNYEETSIFLGSRIGVARCLFELGIHTTDKRIGEWGSEQSASGSASVLLPKCEDNAQ